MKVIVASGGRFHTIHLAKQLQKKNLLQRLYSWSCNQLEKNYFGSQMQRKPLISHASWAYEKLRLQKIITPQQWYVWHDNLFDQWLSKKLTREEPFDLLIGWAHYILQSIPIARQKGAKIALECGSMHILDIQKIITQECALHGFTAPAIDQRNIDKMLEEYEAADAIMVPSSHVKQSFMQHGITEKKIYVAHYGTDLSLFTCKTEKPKKFQVLFVGRVGLAKGIHYLLEAWNQLAFSKHNAELHIVGPIDEQVKIYLKQKKISDNIIWHGGVAQETLKDLYASASLFVLPSLQEGLAMVLLEAMASGLPVLATTRTGAQDFIIENQEGFIVEPNNAQILAEKMLWGFNHQDELFDLGQRAAQKSYFFTWHQYGNQVIDTYKLLLKKKYNKI